MGNKQEEKAKAEAKAKEEAEAKAKAEAEKKAKEEADAKAKEESGAKDAKEEPKVSENKDITKDEKGKIKDHMIAKRDLTKVIRKGNKVPIETVLKWKSMGININLMVE